MALSSVENIIEVMDEQSDHQMDCEVIDPVKVKVVSHPFFMSRSDKLKAAEVTLMTAASNSCKNSTPLTSSLSSQIAASNALNRTIRINLLTSDDCTSGSDEEQQQSKQKQQQQGNNNSFFKKRVKRDPFSSSAVSTSQEQPQAHETQSTRRVNLKNIFSDLPPFPQCFQIITSNRTDNNTDSEMIKILFNFDVLPSQSHPNNSYDLCDDSDTSLVIDDSTIMSNQKQEQCIRSRIPISQCFNQHFEAPLFPDILSTFSSHQSRFARFLSSFLADIHSLDHSNSELSVNVLIGPPGIGKTFLVNSVATALNLELIEIDSTQIRNGKVFETLHTTLTHTTKSFSTFFSKDKTKVNLLEPHRSDSSVGRHVILFDEVEIAFESDRGFWNSLSQFMASFSTTAATTTTSAKQNPLIFLTSNASETFLKSILKFPESSKFIDLSKELLMLSSSSSSHSHFHCTMPLFNDYDYDYRQFLNNSNFIKRLHRIDSNFDFEYFSLLTGIKRTLEDLDIIDLYTESESNANIPLPQCNPENVLQAIHNWPYLETVHIPHPNSNTDFHSYFDSLEFSSLADLISSSGSSSSHYSRSSLKIYSAVEVSVSWTDGSGIGYYHHEYDPDDPADHDILKIEEKDPGLLFASLPDIFESKNGICSSISKELIERTIFPQISSLPHSYCYVNTYAWKDLSRRLLKRFSTYSPSLNSHSSWSQSLTQHILSIESHNHKYSSASDTRRCASTFKRKRKPFFRFINDDLLETILKFDK